MSNKLSTFIKLTESDKRLILVLFIIFILLFVIIGYVTELVKKIMRNQGHRIDTAMHTLVASGMITGPKDFAHEAYRKNRQILFKQFTLPFLIILVALATNLIYNYVIGHQVNLWDADHEGFTTILYTFDWANQPRSSFFGLVIPSDWPPVKNSPHFEVEAIMSYFVVPMYVVGGGYMLVVIQAYIARIYRILKLKKEIFTVDLSKQKLNDLSDAKNLSKNETINTPKPEA